MATEKTIGCQAVDYGGALRRGIYLPLRPVAMTAERCCRARRGSLGRLVSGNGSAGRCEQYIGYGAEDTDFGQVAASRGIALTWVGGAWAYHQYHPGSDPPVQHLTDIVRNAAIFHRQLRPSTPNG